MADDIRVNPTPIQRNINDVAVELTKMYFDRVGFNDLNEVQETYAKFYSIASALNRNSRTTITELLPEGLRDKLKG